jgi:hypothetical protein
MGALLLLVLRFLRGFSMRIFAPSFSERMITLNGPLTTSSPSLMPDLISMWVVSPIPVSTGTMLDGLAGADEHHALQGFAVGPLALALLAFD